MLKKIMSLAVACACVFPNSLVAISATEASKTVDASETVTATDVVFGNGYVIERLTVDLGDHVAYIQRITTEDNISTLTVEELGEVSTFVQKYSYTNLCSHLKNNNNIIAPVNPILRGRVAGYNYRYMTSFTQTNYLTPQNGTYANVLSAVSLALSSWSAPASAVAAIASMIVNANAAPVETKLVTTRFWYEMTEKASGGFIGYHCEYVIGTYIKNSAGTWTYLGSETGDFDSFDVY